MSALPRFRLTDRAPWAVATGGAAADVAVVLSRPAAGEETSDGAGDATAVPDATADRFAASYEVDLPRRLARARATGAAAEVVEIQVDRPGAELERLLVGGVGDFSVRSHRRLGAALARRTRGARRVVVALPRSDAGRLRAFVEGWSLAAYTFSRATKEPTAPAAAVDLALTAVTDEHTEALRRALVTARAVHRARDLANTPASEKSPAWLAREAAKAVRGTRVAVTVRTAETLASQGFGGLVAVGSGSSRPPCLIELRHRPTGATAETPHVVLVGKGITFDTGGLSLKPSDGMTAMKTDMSGGGAVIAIMAALHELDVPIKVTGLVAAAENMPSGSAYRPGDVITQYGGTTVEVLNTDAEGRLVLADALAYADRRLGADAVIDLATLTGAATLGLGRRHAAMFATDDRLAAALERAAEASGEGVWRLPLVEDYRAALDSDVADIAHISRDKHVHGGAITAALFLREFVGERPWVHLDIAGPGRADGDEHEVTRGATGYGPRLLLRWLEQPQGLRPRRA